MHCIGSREELKKMSPNYQDVVKKYSKEMDGDKGEVELHRPFIDDVTDHLPGLRQADAPCTGGHRLLVRLRRNAVRAAPLSV